MRGRRRAAALSLALAVTPVGIAAAGRGTEPVAATTWLVGAATADVSPQPYVATKDAAEFPLCNTAVFDGPRHFDLEEPYIDVNGNGKFDIAVDQDDPTKTVAEPFCDANANLRRDTLYDSGEVAQEVTSVHDPLLVHAIAVSDAAGHTVLIAEVTTQGLHSNVIDAMRALVLAQVPAGTGVVIAATHNESSPDEIGIYGAPDSGQDFGVQSGIDDYYTTFLEQQTAKALLAAYANRTPGHLQVVETRVPPTIKQNLSKTFPTTTDDGKPVAVDPDLRILHATAADGHTVFTVMNEADHNQEIGHGKNAGVMSSDWPGYFERATERAVGGMAMFMPSDIGSIEDAITVTPPTPQDKEGTFGQAQATGETLSRFVVSRLPKGVDVTPGTVRTTRAVFDTPLQNNLFRGAAALGIFGTRSLYTAGEPTGRVGTDLRTNVSLVDIGPQLQIVGWPGEAFPALALGSRWGIDEASCPQRPAPPIPLWHAHAQHRFQMGLAGDLLGYLEPPWAWSTDAGVIVDTCYDDPSTGRDPRGHPHKLETESVGPQSAADAATHLTALLDADGIDPIATIHRARFLTASGAVTRDPASAVALWVAASDDATTLGAKDPIVALAGITSFGTHAVTATGVPMDGNGHTVAAGDRQIRGFAQIDAHGTVVRRYYADVYPALAATSPGAAVRTSTKHPSRT
ncbi:MAG TPA: hypothetical protein VHE83_06815, partial [Mycobacteriales bacterium]|nr:hypothetical protein [Mycobacteriales bacterium]